MKRYFHFLKIHPHKNFIFDNQNLKKTNVYTCRTFRNQEASYSGK